MKDRMALAMIEGAERDGLLEPGTTVVEYTGGSTGPALALVCRAKGYRARIVISDCFSDERIQLMRALGADARRRSPPSRAKGHVTAEDIRRMMARAAELASEPGHYATDQFNNPYVVAGMRESLGEEIWQPDGRTRRGVLPRRRYRELAHGRLRGAQRAQRRRSHRRARARRLAGDHRRRDADPSRCRAGRASSRRTGTRERADDVWTIEDDEALEMTRRLAQEEGIFAGTSSGANVVGALRLAEQLGAGDVVVTLAVDSGFKYMTGAAVRASRAGAAPRRAAAPPRRSRSATRSGRRAGWRPRRRTSGARAGAALSPRRRGRARCRR